MHARANVHAHMHTDRMGMPGGLRSVAVEAWRPEGVEAEVPGGQRVICYPRARQLSKVVEHYCISKISGGSSHGP